MGLNPRTVACRKFSVVEDALLRAARIRDARRNTDSQTVYSLEAETSNPNPLLTMVLLWRMGYLHFDLGQLPVSLAEALLRVRLELGE